MWKWKFNSEEFCSFRLYRMYKDLETGLYYYNIRRYYDCRIGRYIQPDPVSDLNLYAYVDNSPYDFSDPLGMFQTTMWVDNPIIENWYEGHAIHEQITEEAISEEFCSYYLPTDPRYIATPRICFAKDRIDQWKGSDAVLSEVSFLGIKIYAVRCRILEGRVAQGVNRADCLFQKDSSYHCDNNNFGGCYEKTKFFTSRGSNELISCNCPEWARAGGGNITAKGSTGCGGGTGGGRRGEGCSVSLMTESALLSKPRCMCLFELKKDPLFSYLERFLERVYYEYERLGQYLHPVQDFWSHSNSIYVPGCNKMECISYGSCCILWKPVLQCYTSFFSSSPICSYQLQCAIYGQCCIKYGNCVEYRRIYHYTDIQLPSSPPSTLKSGLFDYGGWSALDDFFCGEESRPCGASGGDWAHCLLNKDSWDGWSRSNIHPCGGNIQRDAFWEVRDKAKSSTKYYLRQFCSINPNLCSSYHNRIQ